MAKRTTKKKSAEKNIVADLKSSWQDFKDNKKNVGIAWIADLGFIIFIFSIITHYLETLYTNVDGLLGVMEGIGVQEEITPEVINQLMTANQAAQAYYNTILQTFGIMLLYGLVAYICLHGVAWYITHLSERKCAWNWQKFGSFLARFGLLSIAQVLISLVLLMWYSQTQPAQVGNVTVMSKESIGTFAMTFFIIVAFVVDYLSIMSYGFLISKNWVKNIFTMPFREWKYLGVAYLIFIVTMVLAVNIFFQSAEWNTFFSLFFGLLILLPLFTYMRIFIFKVTKNSV